MAMSKLQWQTRSKQERITPITIWKLLQMKQIFNEYIGIKGEH